MQLGYIAGNLYVEVVSGWRYMYATSTPLCLVMGVGMCWLPSSPRWLLLCAIQGKGNLPETKEIATRCLCRLRGQASPDLVSDQVNLILEELSYIDPEKQVGFREIFQGKCLKAMIIGCGLVFFQQVISYTFSFFPEKWKILWYFIKKDLTRGRDVPLIVPSLEPGLAQRTNRFSGMFGWPVALWEWLYGISSDAALCICQVTGQPSVLYYAATIFQVLTYCCFCK